MLVNMATTSISGCQDGSLTPFKVKQADRLESIHPSSELRANYQDHRYTSPTGTWRVLNLQQDQPKRFDPL